MEDVVCTMRVWHRTNTPGGGATKKSTDMKKSSSFGTSALDPLAPSSEPDHGPELILTPVRNPSMHRCSSAEFNHQPVQMSERFASFGSVDGERAYRKTPQSQRSQKAKDTVVPVSEIMMVDMYGHLDSHRTNITTLNLGFFEFNMESRNGQEILLAFLKNSLPKERVSGGRLPRSPTGFSQNSASTGNSSFDVEALTASRMKNRIENESFSEKLRRKVTRVVNSIEESKSCAYV